jgi:hypothetical protein
MPREQQLEEMLEKDLMPAGEKAIAADGGGRQMLIDSAGQVWARGRWATAATPWRRPLVSRHSLPETSCFHLLMAVAKLLARAWTRCISTVANRAAVADCVEVDSHAICWLCELAGFCAEGWKTLVLPYAVGT